MVNGFGPGGFRIGDASYPALLLTIEAALAWKPPPLEALTAEDLAPLVALAPEFVIIGTGAALRRPPAALVRSLEGKGVGVEAMDSRAAARAWGVLRGEGRRIAAALYPIAG